MASPAHTTAESPYTASGLPGQYDASSHGGSPEHGGETSPISHVADDQVTKPQPLQKRRRVTRACDECRRKKIKCDGKQPCTHCTVYSYDCTYDQPSNRRRNATPQYIESLETQLKRAKALLHVVLPTVDLNDSNIDVHLQNGLLPQLPAVASCPSMFPDGLRMVPQPANPAESVPESHLEAMVKATGQLDLDEEGNWDYHGHSSGLSFMRGLRQFEDMFRAPSKASPSLRFRTSSQDPPSPRSTHSFADSSTALPPGTDLPSKEEARVLCDIAIIDASSMLRVVHLPTFYKQLDRIYETTPDDYGNAEHTFLPLLYAVLALGKLFSKSKSEPEQANYEPLVEEGFMYFKASRQLLDITDCRDLTSLQAIVFMIFFLQCSAKLSTCYAYIGIALRSALRMGLHRSFNSKFNPIESETRKRLFWVIRRMDTYVGAMLGLPRFLEDEDVDQEWPVEVDDEFITETGILPMPRGQISVMTAFNAHTRLIQVLSKICRYVYPIKGTQSNGKNSVTYTVSYSKIRELEQELAKWLDELPTALKPGGEAPTIIMKSQQLLRMAFGHAQLLLYRPFLHYVSQSHRDQTVDQRAFACASACVSVSRNIVHISTEMRKRGLLNEANWFVMYTTFFAIASIMYFVLENPGSSTSFELLRDAQEGKEVLAFFAKRSMAADRCSTALNSMFERLPESAKNGGEVVESRKRRQDSSPQFQTSRPHSLQQDDSSAAVPRRANTHPENITDTKRTTLGHSLPISQTRFVSLGLDASYGSPTPSNPDFFDAVPGLTPNSSTASLGSFNVVPSQTQPQRHSFPPTPMTGSLANPSCLNVPISDISTMMFPSADPLAYPNQPMTTFENRHPQMFERRIDSPAVGGLPIQVSGVDMKPYPSAYHSPGVPSRRPIETDAQLYGSMPMYMMQGAPAQRGFSIQHGSPGVQMMAPSMQFDDLLNQEEWTQTFMDPSLAMHSRGPYGGNAQFGSHGPVMGDWR